VIQKLREEQGMTQRDLAARAKVTQGYVAQLEMGLKNPLDVLQRVRQDPRRAGDGAAGMNKPPTYPWRGAHT